MSSAPRHLDALIIGGGLAGSLLAWRLLKEGRAVRLIDAPLPGHPPAWAVAAGLAAPVAGQRATLLPDAAETLREARELYHAIEAELDAKFWRPLPLIRCFNDSDEVARWRKRCGEPEFEGFLRELDPAGLEASELFQPMIAAFEIQQGGHLNINTLVPALHRTLETHGSFQRAHVDYKDIALVGKRVRWQHLEAKHAVFCEGVGHQQNPLFPALRFQATRGEMLELEIEGLPQDRVLYGSHFLIPLGGKRFLCGATYDREDLASGPTPAGRATLEAGLQALLKAPYTITGQRCGVRPNVLGHEAFWQRHPEHPQLWRLNGLGSKGAWSAPRLSAQALRDLL